MKTRGPCPAYSMPKFEVSAHEQGDERLSLSFPSTALVQSRRPIPDAELHDL